MCTQASFMCSNCINSTHGDLDKLLHQNLSYHTSMTVYIMIIL